MTEFEEKQEVTREVNRMRPSVLAVERAAGGLRAGIRALDNDFLIHVSLDAETQMKLAAIHDALENVDELCESIREQLVYFLNPTD